MTASPARWTSIRQPDSLQRVLHVHEPRYLEKWVRAKDRFRASYWRNGAGDRGRTGDVQLGKL